MYAIRSYYDASERVPYSKNGYCPEMISAMEYLNVKYDNKEITSDWVSTQKKDSEVKLYNRHINDKLVPNVKGMGAKDAFFLLENIGLKVVIQGRGAVSQQSRNNFV